MVRTQIYLTEEEHKGLKLLSKQLGKKQSELIRRAVDSFLSSYSQQNRVNRMQKCKGMWKDRSDDFFSELRREVTRRSRR